MKQPTESKGRTSITHLSGLLHLSERWPLAPLSADCIIQIFDQGMQPHTLITSSLYYLFTFNFVACLCATWGSLLFLPWLTLPEGDLFPPASQGLRGKKTGVGKEGHADHFFLRAPPISNLDLRLQIIKRPGGCSIFSWQCRVVQLA